MSDPWSWLLLALLLAGSGFFSASETALFSLPIKERAVAGRRVRALLEEPRQVLVSVLLGNLLVNVLFFALAPRALQRAGAGGEVLAAFWALLAILICGEILPKTLALRAPRLLARTSALPLQSLVRLFAPARRLVSWLLDLSFRALGAGAQPERGVTSDALAEALERSAEAGLLAPGEAGLLSDIVELGGMRVREIMTPRVDMLAIDLEDGPEERAASVRRATERRMNWLPVVRGDPDHVEGHVRVRDLLVHPERPVEQLVMPVKFVPEVASVLALLSVLHEDRVGEAVVVDEWGGTAGFVTLEDVFEELVGDLRTEEEGVLRPVVPLGEGRYRVQGDLSIRDWNEQFGMQVVPTEFETVGGFVTALLGRIPRAGDRVVLEGGLVCIVQQVSGRRVRTVDLYVDPALRAGAAS